MAWIESHHTLRTHPKVFKLCKELKIGRPQAIGHLHCLWWWAIENRENGDLIGLFEKDIAHAADWDKDPERLVRALKKCGWIGNDMRLHDWLKYAGRLLNERARFRRKREKEAGDETGAHPGVATGVPGGVTHNTVPYRTLPNHKELKTGLLSEKDTQIVLQDIAKARHVTPDSEAARVRCDEIITEISKMKDVRRPLAIARHKAQRQ